MSERAFKRRLAAAVKELRAAARIARDDGLPYLTKDVQHLASRVHKTRVSHRIETHYNELDRQKAERERTDGDG